MQMCWLPRMPSTMRSMILGGRSEEHTSELQSRSDLVCRLLLEKKKKNLVQANFIGTDTHGLPASQNSYGILQHSHHNGTCSTPCRPHNFTPYTSSDLTVGLTTS